MGLFDQVVSALGGGESDSQGNLLQTIMHFVNSPEIGGLSGLLQTLREGGLGDIVNSWLSEGPNLPISAEQIQAVLGGSALQGLAAKLGVTQDQASASLAQTLPQVVTTMASVEATPEAGGVLEKGKELLKKTGLFN